MTHRDILFKLENMITKSDLCIEDMCHMYCCKLYKVTIYIDDITRMFNNDMREDAIICARNYPYSFGPPCPQLKKNKCAVYNVRPSMCRYYPFSIRYEEVMLIDIFRCPLSNYLYNDILDFCEKNKIKEPVLKSMKKELKRDDYAIKLSFSFLEKYLEEK